LERAVVLTLIDAGVADAEISLTLLDDHGIRDLNLRYLGKDRPTDVIAFALGREPVLIGDIYLGAEQAARQASELGVPLAEELVRLAVHGTLHVLGHDHPEGEDREASPMFRLQEDLVRRIRG
jgi:rRNA maturation RNase YbeY